MKWLPPCKETSHLVASGEIEQEGVWLRFLVRLHLMMCNHCSRYAKELKTIANLFRQKTKQQISPEQSEHLTQRILQRLTKAS